VVHSHQEVRGRKESGFLPCPKHLSKKQGGKGKGNGEKNTIQVAGVKYEEIARMCHPARDGATGGKQKDISDLHCTTTGKMGKVSPRLNK